MGILFCLHGFLTFIKNQQPWNQKNVAVNAKVVRAKTVWPVPAQIVNAQIVIAVKKLAFFK